MGYYREDIGPPPPHGFPGPPPPIRREGNLINSASSAIHRTTSYLQSEYRWQY